jgi:hypothetical protein
MEKTTKKGEFHNFVICFFSKIWYNSDNNFINILSDKGGL